MCVEVLRSRHRADDIWCMDHPSRSITEVNIIVDNIEASQVR